MKKFVIISLIFFTCSKKTAAQNNWAAVPCFSVNKIDIIGRLLNNEANNEIILLNCYSNQICNSTYKGFFAYNGYTFHDMDLGIEAHNPNPWLGFSVRLNDCVEYNGKAIISGGFTSVGSDTLWSKSIAAWDGSKWSNFQHSLWHNTQSLDTAGISKMLKHNNNLWIFANFDSTGNNFMARPVVYDGSTFKFIPPIPVSVQSAITEAIMYKDKLVVAGGFYDYPSFDYEGLAQFDGTNWSQVGTGVKGGLSAVQCVAVYNDTLYIGGAFPKAAGNAGNYLMKWDGTQLLDAGFSDVFCGYGAIWRLLTYKNRLYAFGGFSCVAGQKAFGVAYYENGKWTVPQDSIEDNAIADAVIYNDVIYIGGSFKSINGDTTIQKFARLNCPDFDAATGCISGLKENGYKPGVKVYPNPATNKLWVEFESSMTLKNLIITDPFGQQLRVITDPLHEKEINISDLSKGIYFLKVETNLEWRVFKFIKE